MPNNGDRCRCRLTFETVTLCTEWTGRSPCPFPLHAGAAVGRRRSGHGGWRLPEVSGERRPQHHRATCPSSEPLARGPLRRCPRAWGHRQEGFRYLQGAFQHRGANRGAPIATLGEPAAPALCKTASRRCPVVAAHGGLATVLRRPSGTGPSQVLKYAPFCFPSFRGLPRGVSDSAKVHKMPVANCDGAARALAR